jgi:hypothetical protein
VCPSSTTSITSITSITAAFQGIQGIQSLLRFKVFLCSVQKQSICKMSVHGLPYCVTIDDSHKAQYVHQHTHTIYATIDDSHKAQYVHQHTHHIRNDR